MIVSSRCDKAMARSKRLLPCEHNCRSCVCCIIRDEHGNERHVLGGYGEGSDPRLLQRNLWIMGFLK